MNFIEELNLVKKLVNDKSYDISMVLNHLEARNIHHTLALIIISSAFKINRKKSREVLYKHKYYSQFENELNPFTEDLGNISTNLNDNDD